MLTSHEALNRIRQFVEKHGSQKAAAKELGISPQFLCNVLQGYKQPYSIMKKLGYSHVVFYIKDSQT